MANNKKEANKGDEQLGNVENALSKTELWIEKNQKIIYGVIAAIIIVAGIIFIAGRINSKNNEKASNEIFAAEKYFDKKEYETALKGDDNYPGFLEIYDSYSRTKTGKLAAYYAGICYLNLGKYEEAIDYLKKYNGKDDIIAPMALGAIGDCYLELDKNNEAASYYTEEAASYYMKAANKSKNEFTGPLFLTKAGLTYEILGKNNSALKCYKTLKDEYPLTNEAFEISKRIAKMEEMVK